MTPAKLSKRRLTRLVMVIGLVAILTLQSSAMTSSLFIRVRWMDGYLHQTYNLTGQVPVRSRAECVSLCQQLPECGSVFYLSKGLRSCQAHSVLFTTTAEAVLSPGTSYYQLTQARCPQSTGYILDRASQLCYRYFPSNVTWTVARQRCQASGTHLVDVKNKPVSTHLVNFLRASSNTRSFHVSVGGSLVSGSWQWTDGTLASWTNWAQGEPSGPNETCLALAWFYFFSWNDVPCSGTTTENLRAYICQLGIQ